MRNSVIFVLLAFMAMAAAAETVVDFGRVVQGERPERAFEVRNGSERAWRVRDVIRTCSCADLEVEAREVAPGASLKGKVTLDTNVFDGAFEKVFAIRLEDGTSLPVVIRGDIARRWQVDPGPIVALREGEATATFTVRPVAGGEAATITFTPPKELEAGFHRWRLAVWPDAQSAQPLNLTVTKRVGMPWVATPATVFVEDVSHDVALRLLLRPERAGDREALRSIDPGAVRVEPLRDGMTFVPDATVSPRGLGATLTIPKEQLSSWKTPKAFVFILPGHGTATLHLRSRLMAPLVPTTGERTHVICQMKSAPKGG